MDKHRAFFATVMTVVVIAAFIFVPYCAGNLGSQTLSMWPVPATGAYFATWILGWFYLLLCAVALFVVCIIAFFVAGVWMCIYNG